MYYIKVWSAASHVQCLHIIFYVFEVSKIHADFLEPIIMSIWLQCNMNNVIKFWLKYGILVQDHVVKIFDAMYDTVVKIEIIGK